jgi:hypothetical protein
MGNTPLERSIVRKIVRALKQEFPNIEVRKRHGTAFGVAGDPDLYGSVQGFHFELEVKRPGEQPTAIQVRRNQEWRGSGAMAFTVVSAEEAVAFIRLGLALKQRCPLRQKGGA